MKGQRAYTVAWVLLVACTAISPLLAQDVHFSQFYNAPLVVNPANAGDIDGDQRLSLIHREQWRSIGSPFRTDAFSYDVPLLRDRLGGRYLGVGVSAFSDKAGSTGFGDTQGGLSIAYAMRSGANSTLAMGLQGSYGQRSAVLEGMRWDSQYNGAGYDPSLPTNENVTNTRRSFMDLAAGMMAKGELMSGLQWKVGASAFHLTEPSVALLGGETDRLLRRYMVHGEARIEGKRWTWSPKFFATQQGASREITYGTLLHRRLGVDSRFTTDKNSSAFYFGCFHRVGDALIPTMQFEWKRKLVAAMSYDVNIGRMRAQTLYRGGLELGLQWVGMFQDKRVRLPQGRKD